VLRCCPLAAHTEDSDRDSPHSTAGLELQGTMSVGAAAAMLSGAAAPERPPVVPRCSSVAELWSDLSPEEVQVRLRLHFCLRRKVL
jgi:hypothetical protein